MNVGPCISGAPSAETPTATRSVASVAAKLMCPPVSALPRQRMSGATAACSQANIRPLRPKPVAISSKISSTSKRSHNARAWRRYSGA